ncbi:MAG: hypothetical protein ACI9E1_001684 [Cryomorphaceae bacterium]|jgi:hypothetical protein
MPLTILESDWKRFKEVRQVALSRHCRLTLERLAEIASEGSQNPHESYLVAYEYIKTRDREVAQTFNYLRRSTAMNQLILMQELGLLSDEDTDAFSDDVQATIGSVQVRDPSGLS